MKELGREFVRFLREQYPAGSRIELKEMRDAYAPVEAGTLGTLKHIDDMGTFHVAWDNGRTLGLVPGEDSFTLMAPQPTTMKLYMPLTADLFEKDDWGDLNNDSTPLYGQDLCCYEDRILAALVKYRSPEENERGIMYWYHGNDGVNAKVKSVTFTAEEWNGQLWGVAECRVVGDLTPQEMEALKDYISGQASDGWGEGFEQREIETDEGGLYVHLWSWDNWSIKTEQEQFTPKIAEGLPEMCFSVHESTGELICIKRGEAGYHVSEWSTDDKEKNVELADYNNERLGVNMWQRQAMEVGSLCGWDVPGADPAKYQEPYDPQKYLDGQMEKMGGMSLG